MRTDDGLRHQRNPDEREPELHLVYINHWPVMVSRTTQSITSKQTKYIQNIYLYSFLPQAPTQQPTTRGTSISKHILLLETTLDTPDRLHTHSTYTSFTIMSALNDAPKPRIPDAIDAHRLHAMQIVAKMKESADKYGVGFVGGFISPDGQKFMMTNMNEDDTNALLPDDLK
jgi:hypothetical protein